MSEITIYGREACAQCKATLRKAEQLGLTVHYVDLDQDEDTACRLHNEGFRSLPVVFIGDQHWAGFRPDLLDKVIDHG